MFWNTWNETRERSENKHNSMKKNNEKKKKKSEALSRPRQQEVDSTLLKLPSDLPVVHPVWHHPGQRVARTTASTKSEAGDPVFRNFFNKQRKRTSARRAKGPSTTTPSRKIVAVAHSGAFVVTSNSKPGKMPSDFYEPAPPRHWPSYAGGDKDLRQRWSDDRERTNKSLNKGVPVETGVTAAAAATATESKNDNEHWQPMTVNDVVSSVDELDSQHTDQESRSNELTQHSALDVQESYARALVGLRPPPARAVEPANLSEFARSNPPLRDPAHHSALEESDESGLHLASLEGENLNPNPDGQRQRQQSPSLAVKLLRQFTSSAVLGASTATTDFNASTRAQASESVSERSRLLSPPEYARSFSAEGSNSLSESVAMASVRAQPSDSISERSNTLSRRPFSPDSIQGDPLSPNSRLSVENVARIEPSRYSGSPKNSKRYHHRKASLLGLKGRTPVRLPC